MDLILNPEETVLKEDFFNFFSSTTSDRNSSRGMGSATTTSGRGS